LCLAGLRERYAGDDQNCPGGLLAPHVLERLDRELSVIERLGFPNYFLIVWDFVRYARERGIPATARGSGVGALVSYSLYLSHVCPLKYNLLFERFLDISREEAPDIDIDFCKDRRGECIQYVKDKYGEANVAQIGTFGTLAARAAIRDVGRALGMPIPRVDTIVAMVPEELGIELAEALEQSPDLRRAYDTDAEIHELLDLAMKIEGLARNLGTHAAAVVIADRPLVEYVPLCSVAGKSDVITQWSMGDVERAGLLKMDFLGLRNLTILAKAVDLVKQSTGTTIDPLKFPLDDRATYQLLCRGETKGIFQLESGGIRDLLTRMKPDRFNDIIATNALYRPGPLEGGMVDQYVEVKHGRRQAVYPHPVTKEILEETHGVMVYQEQVMLILNRLGGIELADAYKCIKAISKKKADVINRYREQFVAGTVKQGLSEEKAEELFGMIEKFAGYGFNKSHSTAYALIAYQTAYLKAHYPVEFMAALLTGDIQGRNFKKKDHLAEHREDCQRMEIDVLAPDVNRSGAEFTVAERKIQFGLAAIKGCGGAAGDAIEFERQRGGPYKDLFDFCQRLDSQQVNRTAIESLIKAGAFDSLGANRAQSVAVLDKALQSGAALLRDRRAGQRGLFDDDGAADEPVEKSLGLPNIPDWSERERLAAEKEVLGFYLTSHPLAEHESTLRTYTTHTSAQLAELPPRTEVVLGGMLSSLKFSNTKNPRPGSTNTKYVMFDLEDLEGMVRCILWPEDFAVHGERAQADAILAVRGVIDRRPGGDEVNLIVNELIPLEELSERFTRGIIIRVTEQNRNGNGHRNGTGATAGSPSSALVGSTLRDAPPTDPATRDIPQRDILSELHTILRSFPGPGELQLVLCLADGTRVHMKSEGMRVAVNPELCTKVDQLLGPGNLKLITPPPRPTRQAQSSNGNWRNGGR
jgi:DNA polymerase-3 subunit alpha